jgi:hypothetical protein
MNVFSFLISFFAQAPHVFVPPLSRCPAYYECFFSSDFTFRQGGRFGSPPFPSNSGAPFS